MCTVESFFGLCIYDILAPSGPLPNWYFISMIVANLLIISYSTYVVADYAWNMISYTYIYKDSSRLVGSYFTT
jgi:hypothetical protein